jgi:hypothetical protein
MPFGQRFAVMASSVDGHAGSLGRYFRQPKALNSGSESSSSFVREERLGEITSMERPLSPRTIQQSSRRSDHRGSSNLVVVHISHIPVVGARHRRKNRHRSRLLPNACWPVLRRLPTGIGQEFLVGDITFPFLDGFGFSSSSRPVPPDDPGKPVNLWRSKGRRESERVSTAARQPRAETGELRILSLLPLPLPAGWSTITIGSSYSS